MKSVLVCLLACLTFADPTSSGSIPGRRGQYTKAFAEWNQPIKPVRIIGNIYYVGASEVSSFLITTPKGHILLDSGFAETVPLIVQGVNQLGFKIADIKVIINSHAHYDHAAGLAELKRLTGAQLALSEQDAALVANGGKGDFQWGETFTYEPVNSDRILKDMDRVELGGITMTARLTPGHTKGCTTWVMKANEEGKDYDVVFIGSATAPAYRLVDNALYPNIVSDFEYTFNLLRSLPCDVFLGPHGSFFSLKEKIAKLSQHAKTNPFIDKSSYAKYVHRNEEDFRELLAKQQKK